jgi:inositol hexakisphosphate/diphosphoinositol-pentakisphosphate kinase
VIEYVRLKKPFCVNDIPSQTVLENRYDIYQILEKHSIPTPRHLYVDRRNKPDTVVLEHPDWIEIDGVRMHKPLVEKPYDGEDHNIYIYYGSKQGGGSRRLFRKIGNRSSRFYPKVNKLRTDGNYIYESLLLQGKDLKVRPQ